MRAYLVRHAKAGSRSNWKGDDRARPLSKNGWAQAEALAARLEHARPSTLHTSPYLRCRQTLEPLARLAHLDVVDDERLAEGGRFEDVLELILTLPDGAVLCSHGDVIPDTIAALERRGCAVGTVADWRKATVWTIEHDGDTWITASVEAPPPV